MDLPTLIIYCIFKLLFPVSLVALSKISASVIQFEMPEGDEVGVAIFNIVPYDKNILSP